MPSEFELFHALGKAIRTAIAKNNLDAQAASLFLGDDEAPGDLRMVYQTGFFFPEATFGILSRRTVHAYCFGDDETEFGNFLIYVPGKGVKISHREGFSARIRKIWKRDGLPVALIFINFRKTVESTLLSRAQIQNCLRSLYSSIDIFLHEYEKTETHARVRELTRAADKIRGRLYFQSRDFDFDHMTRAESLEIFASLITSIISSHFGTQTCWWTLYMPVRTEGLEAKELRRVHHHGLAALRASQTITCDALDSIESWVFRNDCPLRFTNLASQKTLSRLSSLLSAPHLALPEHTTRSLISVPMTSGTKVFAVATIGIYASVVPKGCVKAADLTNALRSLWTNGRRISRFWRHSVEGRSATFRAKIIGELRALLTERPLSSQGEGLLRLLTEEFHATNCSLWRMEEDNRFHRVAPSEVSDERDRPHPHDGWTAKVYLEGTPLLFKRKGTAPHDAIEIYRVTQSDVVWRSFSERERQTMPRFRPPNERKHWLTQMALPLRQNPNEGDPFGVAWVHWEGKNQPDPDDIDAEWAMQCTDDVALLVSKADMHRRAVFDSAHNQLITVMRALRHDVVGRVPYIIWKLLQKSENAEDLWDNRIEIEGAAELLFSALRYYTKAYETPDGLAYVQHYSNCDFSQVSERARFLVDMLEGADPPIVIRTNMAAPFRVPMEQPALIFALLNLLINAKKYLRPKETNNSTVDETIIVTLAQRENGVVTIEVDDGGCGMPDEMIAKVGKEEFHTGRSLGMGLILSRTLIGHSGSLRASRNERGGMTFTVTFE